MIGHHYQSSIPDGKPFEMNKPYPAERLQQANKYTEGRCQEIVDHDKLQFAK